MIVRSGLRFGGATEHCSKMHAYSISPRVFDARCRINTCFSSCRRLALVEQAKLRLVLATRFSGQLFDAIEGHLVGEDE